MTRAEILSMLQNIVEQILDRELSAVSEDSKLQEDFGLDSVGLLTLAAEVENRFQIYLEDDPEAPPSTLGDILDLIERAL